jgi:hypothetical protein
VQATARDLFAWHLLKIHRYLSGISQGRACSPSAPLESAPSPNSMPHAPCAMPAIGRVVFHVHDEVIVEVPKEQAEEAEQRILEIMRTTPDWLAGCPVNAKAGIFTHYTK